jgi:large subunit ribosomal protein L13
MMKAGCMMRTERTYSAKPSEVKRQWLVVDAAGLSLGRLAARVAMLLRGKHKPTFTPHVDTGDHVIVLNADKVVLTANKPRQKTRYTHSGYPGALREERYETIMAKRPDQAIRWAVAGMLPKNILGRSMLRKLKVYRGGEHPHHGQNPQPYDLHMPRYVVE